MPNLIGIGTMRGEKLEMAPKKVGIIYHFFPHYRAPILNLLRQSEDFQYYFVGDKIDPLHLGVKAVDFTDWPEFIYAPCTVIWRLFFQKNVLAFSLRKDIDAVIYLGDFQFISYWLSALLARLAGKHVLYWSIGWMKREYGLKNLIRSTFYRIPHRMMFYGDRARQIAIQNGFDPQNLYVLNNSLDYASQKEIRSQVTEAELEALRVRLFGGSQDPIVIYTGRVTNIKGLDLLLKAAGKLKQTGRPVNVLIVGDGPEIPVLKALADQLGISVCFYGACYDEPVLARLIMASSVAVLPGLGGLIVMHSMGYGTPIIGRDQPDLQSPEWEALRPGITGDVYRTGDIDDMAVKIEKWAYLTGDRDGLRQRCIHEIETRYTPEFQRKVIESALRGEPPVYDNV